VILVVQDFKGEPVVRAPAVPGTARLPWQLIASRKIRLEETGRRKQEFIIERTVMKTISEQMQGYSYGAAGVAKSPVSMLDFEDLKISAGFTEEDEHYLRLAGKVLADQTKQIVDHWRSGIIASIPNLARHSRTLEGNPIPEYLAASNLRFQQWILDTCLRPYDQDWLDYQNEIALRHTSQKKNKTDGVQSTPYVPLRDVLAFIAVMNETIKPYLAAEGHSAEDVEKMHRAWCKSIQLQSALWARAYSVAQEMPIEW
jgi:Protoglobin